MPPPTLGEIFLWEVIGTALLILLGCGVVATVVLAKSKGTGGGWLLINFGWGFAVFVGASVAWRSGAHLNPAVTLGLAIAGKTPWSQVPVYIAAQLIGAFIGAIIVLGGVQEELRRGAQPAGHPWHLLHRAGHSQLRLEHRDRGHRHVRAGLLDPGVAGRHSQESIRCVER